MGKSLSFTPKISLRIHFKWSIFISYKWGGGNQQDDFFNKLTDLHNYH